MKLRFVNRRARMTLLFLVISAAVCFSVYGGYRALTRSGPDAMPLTTTVEPRDFAIQISANGELQSVDSVTIAVPPVPVHQMRIGWLVPDGTRVNKGDVLVEFDRTDLDLQALESGFDLRLANQKISKGEFAAGSEKTDIQKDKKVAELELAKINEFLPKDELIFSHKQIVEAELDKDYTSKRIVFADVRLGLKGKVYSLDEAILMLERNKANFKISQLERALTSLKLVSPASGLVVYNDPGAMFGGRQLLPGGVVWIGMTLFVLVNPDRMEAKVFVLEKDAGELRPDQPATITLDPFPGLQFTGKVKSIDKVARPIDRDSPVKYFQTIIALDKTDPAVMKPGIKMKVGITAGALKDVIVLPRSAIVKTESGFTAYVRRGVDQFEPVPITIGMGDLVQVVVTEGLAPGQVVALNPPDLKRDFTPAAKKTGS